MENKLKKRIGFLLFNDIQALDLFGPQEVFAEANLVGTEMSFDYETLLVSADGKPVHTQSGVEIAAQCSLDDCPPLHTLIIPGGIGSRAHRIDQQVIDWITEQASSTSRLGSVCTGLFILARTGLLSGLRVTTHWHNADEARAAFPDLIIEDDAIFIRQGSIITAAGVTAGIDMALSLVEEDMGAEIAANVAKELIVFLRRSGGQKQYSSFLANQSAVDTRFTDLMAWIADNLTENLSTESLAARACLSERHFRRVFLETYGQTPAATVERLRIDIAKDWLVQGGRSIAEIAYEVGFQSPDVFTRAFERLVGVTPRTYQQQFGPGREEPDAPASEASEEPWLV
ncbi:MAG: GlxA family transcriptional regulator [Pseudomonadota bacterium]